MYTYIKKLFAVLAILFVSSLSMAHVASAATASSIDGTVYDKDGHMVEAVTVTAWCGGVNFFGGSDITDANGYYKITTDTDRCPLGSELTVSADVDGDGLSDGAAHAQTYTSTAVTINITIGKYGTVIVPEYDAVGIALAATAGLAAIAFVRRSIWR